MTEQEQIKAIAELAGHPEPHAPTPEEISSGSYYQFEPKYLTSRDAIVLVIEKQFALVSLDSANNMRDCIMMAVGINPFYYQGFHLPSVEFLTCQLATPAQLCEALLRATGKWKDSSLTKPTS